MIETIITVEGMMCPNCERHVNEAVQSAFEVESVSSDRTENKTVIVSEKPIDAEKLRAVITEAGYTAGAVTTE